MRYLSFFLLDFALASFCVLLKDEKEMDKIIEDVVHEEIKAAN